MSKLISGIDYYFDVNGLMVLTAEYLLKRGHCCQNACRHCPYGYLENNDPNIPMELADNSSEEE